MEKAKPGEIPPVIGQVPPKLDEIGKPPVIPNNAEKFNATDALNNTKFLEFLGKYPDNESDLSDEEMEKRFRAFNNIETVSKQVRKIYSEKISKDLGISLSPADLDSVDLFFQNKAVESPEYLEEFKSMVETFLTAPKKIEELEGILFVYEEFNWAENKKDIDEKEARKGAYELEKGTFETDWFDKIGGVRKFFATRNIPILTGMAKAPLKKLREEYEMGLAEFDRREKLAIGTEKYHNDKMGERQSLVQDYHDATSTLLRTGPAVEVFAMAKAKAIEKMNAMSNGKRDTLGNLEAEGKKYEYLASLDSSDYSSLYLDSTELWADPDAPEDSTKITGFPKLSRNIQQLVNKRVEEVVTGELDKRNPYSVFEKSILDLKKYLVGKGEEKSSRILIDSLWAVESSATGAKKVLVRRVMEKLNPDKK